ncbi:NADH-quinone oxidoreductase subunit J [Aeromicrobium sp. IC_218]|uniref:NADH-quinone oxidoreductase subunit J n=1 Tax=Aeromicrobium sp. IC_218 TaxID=2545468 RepID=UPI00103AAC59|nr:NADH-quinone oxidoreductase subunit J [Aeromicrobium sp. IC_218]TCJ00872.1 NADH-quinone oxidoreductase subunit J [Aeromicrobium sp. IC_218]
MTAFWVLAPFMVLAALGLVLARKAVHAALCLAVVMISLAVLYAAQGAPFLFAVQIVVYTGAIMMLFLFVLMLVGVESAESLAESIPGQRIGAVVVALVFGALGVVGVAQSVTGAVVGVDAANEGGNVEGLAALMFGPYVLAFEATAALLITAVLGAMVLAHRERLGRRLTQREVAEGRLQDYAHHGTHPGQLPTPGVFARHNAVDTPALLPDGSVVETSVPAPLRARDQVRPGDRSEVDAVARELEPGEDPR